MRAQSAKLLFFGRRERAMQTRLTYAIKYVADMEQAIVFYRDTMGLPLKFRSPGWSEFATGDVTLALHPATADEPVGTTELGFRTQDVVKEYAARAQSGVHFIEPPHEVHGTKIARFRDCDNAACSLSS
jgi:catechol 2,3-dioxygenase-like lactoylglutathione lyase family enzyme